MGSIPFRRPGKKALLQTSIFQRFMGWSKYNTGGNCPAGQVPQNKQEPRDMGRHHTASNAPHRRRDI